MSDISRVLNTAKQAILSELTAINTTGSNIANVNTPNYSRLRPVFSTVGAGKGSEREQAGVQISNIERVYDKYLENQMIDQEQNIGYYDTLKSALDRVEATINESAVGGLSDLLSKFWGAWNDMAANPGGAVEREVLVTLSQNLATTFRQQADELAGIQQDMNATVADVIAEINDYSADIASLNDQITQIEVDGGSANDLRDRRADLLKKISNDVNVQFYEDTRTGINVYLSNGMALVQGGTSWNLDTLSNPENSNFDDVVFRGSTESMNGAITGGQLGALLETRDEKIVSYMTQLNAFAENFVQKVNSQHQLGFDAYGNLGGNFFDPVTEASDMQVSAAIVADPRKIAASATVNGDGDNARAIGALKDEPMYAAASQAAVSNADGGAGEDPAASVVLNNIDEIYKATTSAIVLTRGADALTWTVTSNGGYTGLTIHSAAAGAVTLDLNGTGAADISLSLTGAWEQNDTLTFSLALDKTNSTLNGYYSALTGLVGQDVADVTRNLDRQTALSSQLQAQRESVSGVAIDEEMMNLMKYQAAYNAAGKLSDVLNEMLDVLINLVK